MKHKLFAIFLIVLILFTYISFSSIIKTQEIDIKTPAGMMEAGKLYLAWLGTAFGNMKVITGNVINMDWGANNKTSINSKN